MSLLTIIPALGGSVSGGGGGTTPVPLRIQQYESPSGYKAWFKMFTRGADETEVVDIFYSFTDKHAGKSGIRKKTVDPSGTQISDTEIYISDTKSRRDIGGYQFIDGSGNTVIIVKYVQHRMPGIGETPPNGLWFMEGMGYYRGVYAPDGTEISWTDMGAGSMPDASESDYANYGNGERWSVTGRHFAAAYGTNTAKGIISYSDDEGLTFSLLSTYGDEAPYSENTIAVLSGTNNSNVVLGVIARNDVGKMGFFRSAPGGASWTFIEELPFSSTKAKPPMFSRDDNGNLELFWSDRDPLNFLIRYAVFDPAILATGSITDALLKYGTIGESFINSHPSESSNLPGNFGYPDKVKTSKSKFVGHYDQSPAQQEPWGDANDIVNCDIVLTPFESGDVWVKARQATSTVTFPNGTTDLNLADVAIDNYDAWTNGNTFTAPATGTYDIRINLPISCNNGATKVLNVKKNGTTVYSITETDGLSGTVGKLQGGTQLSLTAGDVVTFSVTVSGATSSPIMQALVTPTTGLAYGIDITNSISITSNIQVRVASSSQSFTNSTPAQITGSEVTDTDNAWTSNQFTIPKTAWYKIRVQQRMPNAAGGRRVIEVYNYEVGQESQEVRRKRLFQVEDKARAGTNTDTDATFYYRLNKGETVKFWFTIYGADVTSVSGAFNCIEIDEI